MLLLVRGMSALCTQLGSKLTALLECAVRVALRGICQPRTHRPYFGLTYAALAAGSLRTGVVGGRTVGSVTALSTKLAGDL